MAYLAKASGLLEAFKAAVSAFPGGPVPRPLAEQLVQLKVGPAALQNRSGVASARVVPASSISRALILLVIMFVVILHFREECRAIRSL